MTENNLDEFYGYDALHQVTDFDRGNLNVNRTAIGGIPSEEESFAYDSTGNWDRYTTAKNGAATLDQTRVNNQDNQITQIDGSNTGILHDKAGNALKMLPDKEGDWSKYYQLSWDAWNRLVKITDKDDATVATYQYDGAARRTIKSADGTTTHFYYNEQWRPIERRENTATSASKQYVWGVRPGHRDELILRDRDTNGNGNLDERLYCLMDYYNPSSVVNPSGVVQERYGFTAFGLRSIMNSDWAEQSSSAHDFDFGFHGQFVDDESGYYDYGFRYYSPEIGRWLNRDPIQEQGGLNLYAFVRNNGVNRNDLLGLFETEFEAFKEARASVIAETDASVGLGEAEIAALAQQKYAQNQNNWTTDPSGSMGIRKDGMHSLFSGEKTTVVGFGAITQYNILLGREYFSVVYCERNEYLHTTPKMGDLPTLREFLHKNVYGTIPLPRISQEIKNIEQEGGVPLAVVHSHNLKAYNQNSSEGFKKTSLLPDTPYALSQPNIDAADHLGIPICAVTNEGFDCTDSYP